MRTSYSCWLGWRPPFLFQLRVLGFLLFVVMVAPRAAAQTASGATAVVVVDAISDPSTNMLLRDKLAALLAQDGYNVVSAANTHAALAAQGAISDGVVTQDAAVLARVRNSLKAVLLVRVARASGGFDWVAASVKVYSLSATASTSSASKLKDAPSKITNDTAPLIPSPALAARPPPRPAAPARPPQPARVAPAGAAPAGAAPAAPGTASPNRPSGPPSQGGSTLQRTPNSHGSELDLQHRRYTAQYQRDCARDPTQEICKEKGHVRVDKHGLKFGWSQQSVSRVKTPPKSSIDFSLDASFVYGRLKISILGSDMVSEFYGGGLSIGVKTLFGKRFPGTAGGSWWGFGFDPNVSFSGAGGSFTTPGYSIPSGYGTTTSIPPTKSGFGMLIVDGGASATVQWLDFGSMDPETLKQSGFGLDAGYHLGIQYSDSFSAGSTGASSHSNTAVSQGPVFGMTFPDYNAGTASLHRAYVQGMILPSSDMLLITIAAGYAF